MSQNVREIEEVKRLRRIGVDLLKEECAVLGDFDDEDRQATYGADLAAWHRDMAERHLAEADSIAAGDAKAG